METDSFDAVYGHTQAVAAILSKGGSDIDLGATDVHGNTALSQAREEGGGLSEVGQLLRQHAAAVVATCGPKSS